MDSLEEKKRANNQIEQNQIKLVSKFLEQQRKRFDYADTAHWILENKFPKNCQGFIYLNPS
jgi:hypothetical protein